MTSFIADEPEKFTVLIEDVVAKELESRRTQFDAIRLRTIALQSDCVGGALELSAMTAEESNAAKLDDCRFAKFTMRGPTENWQRLNPLMNRVRDACAEAGDARRLYEIESELAAAAVIALNGSRVLRAIRKYERTFDFRIAYTSPSDDWEPWYWSPIPPDKSVKLAYRDPSGSPPSVAESWERLERWARTHLPHVYGDLNPPADESHIRTLEQTLGRRLPDDLRESLRIHDGGGYSCGLVYGLQLLPIESIERDWSGWNKGCDGSLDEKCMSFPSGRVRRTRFDPGWIPVTYDSGGNFLAVDLNPDAEGTAGQVTIFGRDDDLHPVLARSWGQFLADIADELERGNFHFDNPYTCDCEFNIRDPAVKHFHSAGRRWSRCKLGLRRLSARDQAIWDRYEPKKPS